MKTQNIWVGRILLALLVLAPCSTVNAGGLYLFDRGARPLSRGGAFVAGADDPSALWYNPAGLKHSGKQLVMDATMAFFFADFQRTDASGNPIGPKMEATPMPLPIPAIAMSTDFGLDDWTFGFGLFAPNVVLMGWPESVQTPQGVEPAPTRYSLINMRGSLLSNLTAGVAYHGIEGLSIGADVMLVAGRFKAKTALSTCDQFVCGFEEDYEYDATVTIDLFPTIAVTGVAGFTFELGDIISVGGSVTFPYSLKGTAHLDIDLPKAELFETASVKGDEAEIELKFPFIYRVGGQIKPAYWLRMEGVFQYEQWSVQDEIPVKPHNMEIQNVRGLGNYDVGRIAIQRNMNDAWSVRGGFEANVPERWMVASLKLAVRGGLAYEKSAFASKALSPLTIDSDKVVLTGGLGLNLLDNVRFDTVAGWIFMKNVNVRDSEIMKPAAIRPASASSSPIGNGNYAMEAFYLGGGFAFELD